MALEYFCGYHSLLDAIDAYGDAERGRIFTALLVYSKTGVRQELSGNERYILPMLFNQIDRDKQAYEERCNRNRENIGKRWNTAVNDGTEPNTTDTKEKEKAKENTKAKEKEKESIGDAPGGCTRKFVPPSLEEVTVYCGERRNQVDPQRFVDYYLANGWKVGKNPMKDWKAAVRTWEKSESGRKPVQKAEKSSGNPFLDALREGKL